MAELVAVLVAHGYALLFGFVLTEQLGLPLPAAPLLLATGALAATGHLGLLPALGAAVLACLVADTFWHQLGRRRGPSVLGLLCRISLEPDSCVRRTEETFLRYGARALLVAKFVPGLNAVAAPLAGVIRMPLRRFLAWDVAGALLWSGTYLGLGYLFSAQLEVVAGWLSRLGTGLGLVVGAALGGYVAWKYLERRRLIRALRGARITPEELRPRLAAGEDVVIVDLRSALELGAGALKIPGALALRPEDLDRRAAELRRARDVVLYCS